MNINAEFPTLDYSFALKTTLSLFNRIFRGKAERRWLPLWWFSTREATRCCAFSGTTTGCKRSVHARLCRPPALRTSPSLAEGSPPLPSVLTLRCWFMRPRWRAADSRTVCPFGAAAARCLRVSHRVAEPQAHSGGLRGSLSLPSPQGARALSSDQRPQGRTLLLALPGTPATCGPHSGCPCPDPRPPFFSFLSVHLMFPVSPLLEALRVLRTFDVINYKFCICLSCLLFK